MFPRRRWWKCGDQREGDCCDVTVCVPASAPSLPTLISPVDLVCELDFFRFQTSKLTGRRPFRFPSRRRGASVALEREQRKRAKANMETTPGQSLSVLQRTPFKAVPECVGSATCSRRNTAERKADVAWTTIGPTS